MQSDQHPKQEEEEDPITEVIRLVVQTLLREEGFQVCCDMVEYRKNLSRRLLERLPDLEGQPADVTRFYGIPILCESSLNTGAELKTRHVHDLT